MSYHIASEAERVFNRMIDDALYSGLHGHVSDAVQWNFRNGLRVKGRTIPDRCKPGYLLSRMSEDERKTLQSLTSDELNRNVPRFMPYDTYDESKW